jgi:hypothetical protein
MTAAKSARNRRSAEQKLVELKRRLREISDLTAAGDVLNWDQATYMPRGGADARGRQCAALYRLAHEQAVAPALGKLLDALAHYGESLPHDSDDASLIRVARRDFQKMIKIPPDHVARANAHGSASHGPGLGRRTTLRPWCPISNGRSISAGNIPPTLRLTSTWLIRTSTTPMRA